MKSGNYIAIDLLLSVWLYIDAFNVLSIIVLELANGIILHNEFSFEGWWPFKDASIFQSYHFGIFSMVLKLIFSGHLSQVFKYVWFCFSLLIFLRGSDSLNFFFLFCCPFVLRVDLLRNAFSPQVSSISRMSTASDNWCGPLQPLEVWSFASPIEDIMTNRFQNTKYNHQALFFSSLFSNLEKSMQPLKISSFPFPPQDTTDFRYKHQTWKHSNVNFVISLFTMLKSQCNHWRSDLLHFDFKIQSNLISWQTYFKMQTTCY